MSYKPEHYNAVFTAMRHQFGEEWFKAVNPFWWNIWRRQIKERFFDQGILIREMTAGLDEAAQKMKWPSGKAFFHRLEDVCLKNRRESRAPRTGGLSSLKDLVQGVR